MRVTRVHLCFGGKFSKPILVSRAKAILVLAQQDARIADTFEEVSLQKIENGYGLYSAHQTLLFGIKRTGFQFATSIGEDFEPSEDSTVAFAELIKSLEGLAGIELKEFHAHGIAFIDDFNEKYWKKVQSHLLRNPDDAQNFEVSSTTDEEIGNEVLTKTEKIAGYVREEGESEYQFLRISAEYDTSKDWTHKTVGEVIENIKTLFESQFIDTMITNELPDNE